MAIGGNPARTRRTLLAPAVVLLVLLTLLAACAIPSSRPSPTMSYTPVPDTDLYRHIAALPHVTRVDIAYAEHSTSRWYMGAIYTDGQENPYVILDNVIAILRQGALDAGLGVQVYFPRSDGQDVAAAGNKFFDPRGSLAGRRYGSQPGSGIPPASPPVPTPTNWSPPAHPTSGPPAST